MEPTRRHLLQTAATMACGSLLPPLLFPLAGTAAAGPLGPGQARAEGASAEGTQVRLIPGPVTGGIVQAGLEIGLAAGWKTYWRYPGDSGVPPRFNWSASRNVADVTVLWPAPKRFSDGSGGFSIGYKDTVILPLEVRLTTPGTPALLDLALDFAVCQALCVPADAHVSVELPVDGAPDPRLAAAFGHVPVRTPLGAPGTPAILKLETVAGAVPPRLVVTARAAPGALLFLEGPDDSWALPLPEPEAPQGDILRFAAPLIGVPADTQLAGARLTLTLVDGARAIETQALLPAAG
ncbi:protein-disulfide reductase DsbD domain-containing protein [Azorhizobium doebereinerae]|uniref:protein-disulfide reductase DsbD domain-containing protein n=1 Tax=Azorhizobium doebereinerae TaxID=281091 RepID=UPI0004237D4E|nr:protein-disulfide reductase DsbD domain-containing protein [Azorhizobium doebereinerae]